MEKKIIEINKLRAALMEFTDKTNGKQYRDKSPLEQDIEELVNGLYMHLDRYKLQCQSGECAPTEQTKKDQLATKLMCASNALRKGTATVDDEVADDFIQAVELFDLSREAKEKGKTAALKDKYKNI